MNTRFKGPRTTILGSKQVRVVMFLPFMVYCEIPTRGEGNRYLVKALSGTEDKEIHSEI